MVQINKKVDSLQSVDYNPFEGPEIEYIIPCTEPQVEILTACMLGGNDANLSFNESISLAFSGELNQAAMHIAFQQLVNRHESLRAAFSLKQKQVCVFKSLTVHLDWKDISLGDEYQQQEATQQYLRGEALHPFDLVNGPLIKACLLKYNAKQHTLVLTAHHIVCDGWSLGIILQDLSKLYSLANGNKKISIPTPALFSQYAREQAAFLQSEECRRTEQFWLQQYQGNIPELNLPADFERPAVRTYKSNRLDYKLDTQLVADLKQIGTRAGCSLVTTLMAGFETFLYRLTGQQDIVIGLPAAGQSATANYYLVGHCVNLLPLRSNPTAGISFTEYLKKRKPAVFDAYEHQQLTFGSLLKKLRVSRDPARIPLVPVVFNIDMGMDDKVDFEGLTHRLYSNPRAYENFEIFLNISGSEKGITLEWSYNTQLFKRATIDRMMLQLEQLLVTISANPQVTLGSIQLAYSELNEVKIARAIGKSVTYPGKSLHEIISNIAATHSGKTALVFESQRYTYLQLETAANQLAHYLLGQGIDKGDFIAIALDRSPEMLISLLAVMKTGAAYIPLDPDYPADRIAFILQDAGAKILLTASKYTTQFSQLKGVIAIEQAMEASYLMSSERPQVKVAASDLVYVLYTSGSTGKPKGVMIEHRSLVNLLFSMFDFPGFTEKDVLLAVTTIAFDIAGLEMYLPLVAGATMVMASSEAARDGHALLKLIQQQKVSVIQATPSTYKMMLAAQWEEKLPLKILCCGEPLPKELANRLLPRCTSLWNMYGPTETTIYSTGTQVLSTDEIITIGKPINNTQVFIVNDAFKPLPEGTIGEITICGDGLARGYLNRPALTSEKFIEHPFEAGKKMYRSGDLGKILPGGEILCLGRIDHQVKIRGYRIETGEVENILESLDGISEAAVLCKTTLQGDALLVAYVVPQNVPAIANNQPVVSRETIANWRTRAGLVLPAYMVPAHFEVITAMPLTPNGKTDRKALPEPVFHQPGNNVTADQVRPLNATEKFVADVWSGLLNIAQIGLDENFFHLGGHSLIAIEVMARIEKETGKRIPPSTLFQYPTIAGLSAAVDGDAGISKWKSLVPIKPSGTKDPLYIIHGAGLDVMVFNNIARHMEEDQPVYGIKAKGIDGDEASLNVIEEMAAFYISEMLEQNPEGPYALVGFSAGSVIAFEMTRQLKAMNKEVKITGIIDYDLSDLLVNKSVATRALHKFTRSLPWFGHLVKSLIKHPKKTIQYQWMCIGLRYVTLLNRLGLQQRVTEDTTFVQIQEAQANHEAALRQYTLLPSDIAIDLFVTNIKVYYLPDPVYLGWKPYALCGINIHAVPGDHDDMIQPPNDKVFAGILQEVLNKH